MARQAAVVAQENQTEFDLEVLDMVMYGRYAHRRFLEKETEEDLAICRRFLEEVGLKGYENRSFFSLSGGEKQRVLMARTLAQESRLILLDEPTNHLDIRFQYLLMEILKKQDATIFSSVHDLNIAAMYCDRILLMDRGRIIKAGTPEEILTEENILQIFGIHAQITKNPITQKIQVYYIPKG
jgi:iron complex transport system ATP-binding protein